ncbi:ethylbenzene dehydrogenase-related protein [Candidatus Binatia bacterium]|nr:ethylbenzene dehydrogenase-related protein [Candidatus Binatia bacterium]
MKRSKLVSWTWVWSAALAFTLGVPLFSQATHRLMAASSRAAIAGPGVAAAQDGVCVGNCNGDAEVTIDEIIIGVNIALGSAQLSECPIFDSVVDGQVTVDEIILAVTYAQNGCPAPPSVLRAARVAGPPTGIDDPAWSAMPAFEPTLANMVTNLVYGDGQLNMSGTYNGSADFNDGQPAGLKLRAVHDGTKLYILAEWNDRSFNRDRRRWLFNGPADPLKAGESAAAWTSQLNDDKIGLAFEIESAESEFGTFANAGCAASCHVVGTAGLDMRPQTGKVDIWHWKASRSEPLGHVADQVSAPDRGRTDDAGTGIEQRNRPSGGNDRSGPATEWDGTPQVFVRWDGHELALDPAYVILDGFRMPFEGNAALGDTTYGAKCAGCHGNVGQGGFATALNKVEFTRRSRAELGEDIAASSHPGAAAFASLTEQEKTDLLARLRGMSGVPGYYLKPPTGSAADIVTQSNVEYELVVDVTRTNYRVLMVRLLDTGHDDDARFTPGNAYVFGVALMDNDGRNHIGSRKETLNIDP